MKRVENVNIVKGISVISISTPIKNSKTNDTHKWKLFIRGANGDSLKYIKTVTYTLHETFLDPVRETTFPFMIEERGWGEFKVLVRIKFIDANEKSIVINHFLKLQENECVSETYEEIVFRSPSYALYEALGGTCVKEGCDEDEEELERIEKAIDYVLDEYEKN